MPYPRNVRSAFAKQMQTEHILHALAESALSEWFAYARDALNSGLSFQPDPTQWTDTRQLWSVIFEHLYLHGAGIVFADAMTDAAAALGINFPDPPPGAVTDSIPTVTDPRLNIERLRRRAERIVARVTQTSIAGVPLTAAGRSTEQPYTVRQAQTAYLATARNRYTAIPDSTYTAITRDLDKGLAAGESTEQMAARVQTHLSSDAVGKQARMIARTESASTMTSAVIQAAKAQTSTGTNDLQKVWVATVDSKTRREHWKLDGQRVPIDGKFHVGRYQLDHPGDGPPEMSRNCRCAVIMLRTNEPLPFDADRHTERLDGRDSTVVNRDGRTQQQEIDRRAAEGDIRARDEPDPVQPPQSAASKPVVRRPSVPRNPEHAELTDDDIAARIDDAKWIFSRDSGIEIDEADAVVIRQELAELQAEKRYRAKRARVQAEKNRKDAEVDRLIAEQNYVYEQAVEQVYGISYEQQMRAAVMAQLRADGVEGRSFDEITRNAYRVRLRDEIYMQAENDTRGAMLNPKNAAKWGSRPYYDLWKVPYTEARKYASEELRQWWDQNGRVTLEDFRQAWLDGNMGYAGRTHHEDFLQ